MIPSRISESREQAREELRALALLSSFAAGMHETCNLIVDTLLASDARQDTGSLLVRYQAEKKQRQKLHEQIIEMQGNIRRPMDNTVSNASAAMQT